MPAIWSEGMEQELIDISASPVSAVALYESDASAVAVVERIEVSARSLVLDGTTEKGRREIASVAHKVARSKTYLDGLGKDLVAEIKARAGAIDARRRVVRERLDALKEEIRAPVTEYEERERARVDRLKARLAALQSPAPSGVVALQGEIALFERVIVDETWQEFGAQAQAAKENKLALLRHLLKEEQAAEAAAAAAARERALAEKAAQAAREESIRQTAQREAEVAVEGEAVASPDDAGAEAEAKAEAEKARAVAQAREEERAAAAAEQRKREAERASQARRVPAGMQAAGRAEAQRALVSVCGLSVVAAVSVVDAIEAGRIPGVTFAAGER